MRTHYQNLKLDQEASAADIRQAFRSLSQQFHPDKNHNSPESVRTFVLVKRAYDVLSDPASRRRHDHWIRQGKWREQQQQHLANSRQLQQQAIKVQQYQQVLAAKAVKMALRQQRVLRCSQTKQTLIRYVCAVSIAAGSSAIGHDSEQLPAPLAMTDSAAPITLTLQAEDKPEANLSRTTSAVQELSSEPSTIPGSQWLQENIF